MNIKSLILTTGHRKSSGFAQYIPNWDIEQRVSSRSLFFIASIYHFAKSSCNFHNVTLTLLLMQEDWQWQLGVQAFRPERWTLMFTRKRGHSGVQISIYSSKCSMNHRVLWVLNSMVFYEPCTDASISGYAIPSRENTDLGYLKLKTVILHGKMPVLSLLDCLPLLEKIKFIHIA